jgi:hypothetical protein
MNTVENKYFLWSQTNHLYKKWMKFDSIMELFERQVAEADASTTPSSTLEERNAAFLKSYPGVVAALTPSTPEERSAMLEEEALARQAAFRNQSKAAKKEVAFERGVVVHEELADLRRLLVEALDRVDALRAIL